MDGDVRMQEAATQRTKQAVHHKAISMNGDTAMVTATTTQTLATTSSALATDAATAMQAKAVLAMSTQVAVAEKSSISTATQPFELPVQGGPLTRSLLRMAKPIAERALSLTALNQIYDAAHRRMNSEDGTPCFAQAVLDHMGVTVDVDESALSRLAVAGPLVVVANHPFGGIEGLVLEALLKRVRPDMKLLANYMLSVIPELRESFFFVDPFGGKEATKRNVTSMRSALNWVKDGHVLGVFPAGEVSSLDIKQRQVVDPTWSNTIARIIRKSKATVVSVFFEGGNGPLFQMAGLVHPRLRTLMLPRQAACKRGHQIVTQIGRPVAWSRLQHLSEDQKLTDSLRIRTYMLKSQRREADVQAARKAENVGPIASPIEPSLILKEVEALPPQAKLLSHPKFDVYLACAEQIPSTLKEIGRLREISFRQVGEGTGQLLDIDPFDAYYKHLFVWDREQARVVGAYRLGLVDEILEQHGKAGLYTSTLFHFKRQLLEELGPAIELGRSFVRPEYQATYAPLKLLWNGVGEFVAANPQRKCLFGPVSISADYSSISKQILMKFLELNKYVPNLEKLVKPRNPPRMGRTKGWDAAQFSTVVKDLKDVNRLVSDFEADGKSMPVLLRQYLKLNAVLLGFNVDPEFGDVLDGLMLVDLTKITTKMRRMVMGPAANAVFESHYPL